MTLLPAINLANVPTTPRLDEYFGLWAVDDMRFSAMVDRISRMDLRVHVEQTERPKAKSHTMLTPMGALGDGGGGDAVSLGNIAVVAITGSLMKQVGSLEDGSSTIALRRDVRTAAADPAVAAILLLVDSPGGTVSGTSDLAAEVSAAAAKKPVYAYVEDLCASAAYWVASCATKIFANGPTALVGSIGTYAGLYDFSGMAGQQGIKAKLYKTGSLKGAGFPGTEITAEQDANYQKLVDETQSHFSAAVQKNRKLSAEQMAKVTTGAAFLAAEAKTLGLIDGIQTFDETMAALEAAAVPRKKSPSARMAEDVLTKEIAMNGDTTTTTAAAVSAAAPAVATAGSLKDLKAALPKASADFLVKAMDDGLTVAQAKDRYLDALAAENEDLRAKSKPVGVAHIGGGSTPAPAAADGEPESAFKAIVDGHIKAGMPREKAWSKAARENKEAHASYLSAYNARNGRRGR
jgi:signal peptide peptidase SppA